MPVETTIGPVDTLDSLIRQLNLTMGSSGLGDDATRVRAVRKLMQSYTSNAIDWGEYAIYEEGTKYTRNLVDDGNGKYNLLILVWGEGKESPIHDHAGSHCMMKLLAGELDEELYSWPKNSDDMKLRRVAPLKRNSVAYMHDKLGLHRIKNSGSGKAVSLHLYSPPYDMCKTFDQTTGEAKTSSCKAFRLAPATNTSACNLDTTPINDANVSCFVHNTCMPQNTVQSITTMYQ